MAKQTSVHRHYGTVWNVWSSDDAETSFQSATVHTILLSEIRDELKTLNRLLGCRNFLDVPTRLRAIDRTLKQKKEKLR